MPLDTAPAAAPLVPLPMAEERIAVRCGRDAVWRSLTTVPPLPRWSKVVRGQPALRGAAVRPGVCRTWQLALGRRSGRVTERCLEAQNGARLVYLVEPGTGRLARFLTGLVFVFDLEEPEQGKTALRLRTYYPVDGALGRLLRAPSLRREFATLRMAALRNLKRAAERAAARSLPVPEPWEGGAVVPPVMMLTKER